MGKRIVAGILGAIATLASALPLGYALEAFKDLKNPDVQRWQTFLGGVLMCVVAVIAASIGIRFLRFAASGQSPQSKNWMKPILLGIGSFFPGFIFSLPLTILWARLTWPGDGQSDLAAMQVSLYIGAAAAVICTVALLKKRAWTHTS